MSSTEAPTSDDAIAAVQQLVQESAALAALAQCYATLLLDLSDALLIGEIPDDLQDDLHACAWEIREVQLDAES